ncbi:MAG: SDR family oxidoreductase [Cyclobacteriaceae bacterium]|nr:SDR family oxidoreductase [Cyclobacteriaceae bacterium HetDA_MAG_MS6]
MQKKYLVVGGSSGIGLALVKKLSDEGSDVSVWSRTHETIKHLPHVLHSQWDIVSDQVPELESEYLHGLVYCPGSINLKPFHRLTIADFQEDFEINVLGAVKAIQAALPKLKQVDHSGIVLFSTVAVGQGMSFHASIASAKGAVEGLTKSLAAELAPNIRVNCIAPSVVDTPLAQRLVGTDAKKEASERRHPLARIGQPIDIAEAAHYLLSDRAGWITGQVLGIDGGLSSIKML